MSATEPKTILVTGDVVRDIYIYQGDRVFPAQQGKIAPHSVDQAGGAKGLYDLVAKVHPRHTAFGFKMPLSLRGLQVVHVLWGAFEGGTKEDHEEAAKKAKPSRVWRVSQPLGYGLGMASLGSQARSKEAARRHAVIVIDDAGLAFRTQPSAALWPSGIQRDESQPRWIIHKMANPIAQGDLWRALIGGPDPVPRPNLIAIVSAEDLRRAGTAISRGFSWERTLSELCAELNQNPLFRPLLRFPRHLIVNFDSVAAIWFDNTKGDGQQACLAHERATLIYDPTLPEDGWMTRLADTHSVYGHLNTFTAAIAVAAAEPAFTVEDLNAAIQRGLDACRQLRLLGHGQVSTTRPRPPFTELARVLSPHPTGPVAVADRKKLTPHGFQVIKGACSGNTGHDVGRWTLASLAENPADQPHLPLYGLAHRVALYGHTALQRIPHAHFGNLLSVDRQEMETLRSLTQLIHRYKEEEQPKQPLSIATFGPPGAGKSFGVTQIAKAVLQLKDEYILTFNLSQFSDPSELFGAFHQVRDKVLKGITPVVFWDEFDSRNYMWLQYLLAPMQDGSFEENGHTHAIGKCIFVFAGATSWDFKHFGPAPLPEAWTAAHSADPKSAQEADGPEVCALASRYAAKPGLQQTEEAARADFRAKKGPDFLSRLDGHIDVLGPNQRMGYDWSSRAWTVRDEHDITFPIRRAILLRLFLGAKKPKDTLNIDRDLLRAFLIVPRYRHGARSLEKIARHLAVSRPPFRRANLPPPQVLEQHLESQKAFDEIYRQNLEFLAPDSLDRIAAAIDENYERLTDAHAVEEAKKKGVSRKPRTPLTEQQFSAEFQKKAVSPDSWQQWLAATNRAAAHRLPWLLDTVGLRLAKGKSSTVELKRVFVHIEHHLVALAAEEHALWMTFHLENGWQLPTVKQTEKLRLLRGPLRLPGPPKYKAELRRLKVEERRHTLLRSFHELPPHEQSKDHDSILHLPDMAALVGWKIEFV